MVSGAIQEKATTDTRIAREVAAIHETAHVNAQLAHNAFAHDILHCKEWKFSRKACALRRDRAPSRVQMPFISAQLACHHPENLSSPE
jgi:hypothetical protein